MKSKNILYCILCGVGGGLIGIFAGRLDSLLGSVMFTIGIILLVFSIIRISK